MSRATLTEEVSTTSANAERVPGIFDSIYPYTRIGRVDDPASLPQVLGPGSVRITFSLR